MEGTNKHHFNIYLLYNSKHFPNRMKDGYAERVKEMTRSLEQLQAASEKREAMEKKLRAKLEEELNDFRSKRRADNGAGGAGSASTGGAGADSDGEGADELAMKLGEAEEKVNIICYRLGVSEI